MARPKKIKQVEDKPTTLEEPKNPNVELYYSHTAIFFSHNSVDQIHPRYLNSYFEWFKLPKVSLNWISQTEATINLPYEDVTQFKLLNWFAFGPAYFNVAAIKMISQTGTNKVFQYHLKMNIHNTFLPKIFRDLQHADFQEHLVNVKRTTHLNSYLPLNQMLSKNDPLLNFENKKYTVIQGTRAANKIYALDIVGGRGRVTESKFFPTHTFNTNGWNHLFFAWKDLGGTSNPHPLALACTKNYENQVRYTAIKWYVWKNPKSLRLMFVPSLGLKSVHTLALVGQASNDLSKSKNLSSYINPTTGFAFEENTGRYNFYYHYCPTNDEDIESQLLNSSTDKTEFANQENFIGAFFGPAFLGEGQWHLVRPIGTTGEQQSFFTRGNFLCFIPHNNLAWKNYFHSYPDPFTNLRICNNSLTWDANTDTNLSYNYILMRPTFFLNIKTNKNGHPIENSTFNIQYILTNCTSNNIKYALIDEQNLSIIPPEYVQFSNGFSLVNNRYATPYDTFTYNYPSNLPIITNSYQQYLNSVRNTQDTSIGIAKQNMIVNTSQHIANGVIGTARGVATAATNWYNPSKVATGSLDAAQAVSDAAFGVTREILSYQNMQKEIQASNLDKKNSIGAQMMSSDIKNTNENLVLGNQDYRAMCYVYQLNKPSNPEIGLHDMYWTSYLVKLPSAKSDFRDYSSYLFWHGIYLDVRVPVKSLNDIWKGDYVSGRQYYYLDVDIDEHILNSIFPTINMDYRAMIKVIFENGLRLFVNDATPTSVFNFYSPYIR